MSNLSHDANLGIEVNLTNQISTAKHDFYSEDLMVSLEVKAVVVIVHSSCSQSFAVIQSESHSDKAVLVPFYHRYTNFGELLRVHRSDLIQIREQ